MKKVNKQTLAVRAARPKHDEVKPVSMPIFLSSTYEREQNGSYASGYVYSRNDNPNRQLLESALANLEGGTEAFAFSSGMAAISAVFQSLCAGDHVLIPDDVYFKLYQMLSQTFSRWGLTFDLVDMTDIAAVDRMVKPNTKLIWIETPSNPMLKITDIHAISNICKKHDLLLSVDNTWATPILLNPIDLGADIVVHSTTKYFGGHSDVLGGAVICKDKEGLSQRIGDIQVSNGAVPSPFDCWLITRGIQTLPLRVKSQSETAFALADYLSKHAKVEKVNYPGLASHTGYVIATAQMKGGYGAMLSIEIAGNESKSRQVANDLILFTQATSLGGVESLVEHRRSVEGPDSLTPVNLLRLSVGLEHIDDLISDFAQALDKI